MLCLKKRIAGGSKMSLQNVSGATEIKFLPNPIKIASLSIVCLIFTGCLTSIAPDHNVQIQDYKIQIKDNQLIATSTFRPHVVVAVIDDGINPYHEVFRRPNLTMPPSEYIPNFPKDAKVLNLTLGNNFWADYGNDANILENTTRNTLYWIPGTNIMAYSINDNTILVPSGPDSDDFPIMPGTHGTGCAYCILVGNPDVSLLIVECGMSKLEEAISWTINQSWVDVISISSGVLGGLNTPQVGWENVSKLTKCAVERGKIVIAAGGNRIVPSLGNDCSGPPWIISVGGVNEESNGEVTIAAKSCDVVAGFRMRVPAVQSINNYTNMSGTSLSAPLIAGVVSKIVFELRKTDSYCGNINDGFMIKTDNLSINNLMIRDALNKTAVYWNTTDYNPTGNVNSADLSDLGTCLPILPVATFLQMGWGYVGPEIVDDAIELLLGQKQYEPSLEKQLAEPYMKQIYEIRKSFWDSYDG
jgi:subtilisin family serine protease